jgi:hypothetical protein
VSVVVGAVPVPGNATAVSPVVFLDPSGLSFPAPGVRLTIPVTAAVPAAGLLYPGNPYGPVVAVHRLTRGVWVQLESTVVVDAAGAVVGVAAVTYSFSAYGVLVLAGTPPAAAGRNETDLGNGTRTEAAAAAFPMAAVIGGAAGGVCLVLASVFLVYRLRHRAAGRTKAAYVVPPEHLPRKPPPDYYNAQVGVERDSRLRNSATRFAFADEEEPENADPSRLAASAASAGPGPGGALGLALVPGGGGGGLDEYMRGRPSSDAARGPAATPFAIAELIRAGQLLPAR